MEKTLIIVKPDAVQRKLIWKIMQRFEDKGLKLTAAKFIKITEEQANRHYEVHKDKAFFPGLVEFMTGYPVFAAVLEGENAIKVVRQMTGKTNHLEAEMGTIRGDYAIGHNMSHNVLHSSDSEENAEREINIFFKKEEVLIY